MRFRKYTSLFLAVIVSLCTVLTACSDAVSEDGYTVINRTSSDVSVLVDALGADYISEVDAAAIASTGKNVFVCISENGSPFDLSGFNDNGYIIRQIDDDIVICGKNENACAMAVDYFVNQYVYAGGALYFAKDLNYVHGEANRLGKVTLGGKSIEEYTIVIPADFTVFEEYVASVLQDHLFDAGGIIVEITDDSSAEGDCEIIIGKTSRSKSPTDKEYGPMEYYLGLDGNDIVLDGDGYMVGGGVGKLIADYLSPEDCGDVELDGIGEGAIYTYEPREAKSVILMIGDGMGFNHIKSAKYYQWIDEFFPEYLPALGESITYCYGESMDDHIITDSAAGATALACGYKTYKGAVGLDYKGNSIQNVRELAESVGARTAVITTDYLAGATPSGFLAHAPDRGDTGTIYSYYPNISVEYVRAGIGNDLMAHTKAALSTIGESGEPFFMMVEEAYTDIGAHNNDFNNTLEAVYRFNETIAYVMTYVVCHTDTVLIITADHETGGIILNREGTEYIFTTGYHTNVNVPVYAIGDGTEETFGNKAISNVLVGTFIAEIFGDDNFGNLG